MTAIFVTVNHFAKTAPDASRPFCAGCTPPPSAAGRLDPIIRPERATYQVVGASGTIALCRDCAIHTIKSLAARFMMFDPSATRDLMSFFAAEASKKRPAARKRRAPKGIIDVIAELGPLLLENGKKLP